MALPEIEATEAAIIDLQNGLSYFEINGSGRWPLASLAKIVTAVVAIQKMDLNREIVISEEDLIFSSEEGQKLKAGDRYQLRDLISVMIAVSCNEAAEAIANAFGRAKFIEAMNDLASEWGLSSSYFKDPVGISISNQSTIKDIYKLVKKVLSDYPEIFKFSRQTRATIKELNSGKIFRYDSNNQFAGRADFLGGKTGYTDDAIGNLVSIFTYGKKPILIVVLGASDRFGETSKLLDWFKANYRY